MASEDEKKEVDESSHKEPWNKKKNKKNKGGSMGREGGQKNTNMKIGSWNIRGFNSPLSQKKVSKILNKYSIDIFGVIDCKMEKNKVEA